MKKRRIPSIVRDVIEIIAAIALFVAGLWFVLGLIVGVFGGRDEDPARLAADVPAEGIGRIPVAARYLGGEDAVDVPTLEIACEFDDPLPWWWDPENAIPVEEYHSAEVGKKDPDVVRKDGGCPDWNLNSSLVGWDGRTMEVWEMDLFSRIFYREFWQPNLTLCEAGCDAMLRLWELDGGTMFETLSHVNENGSYAFSTYPGVWEEYYDPNGLAWCKAFCEERFYKGPTWTAQYFRKGQYHDWDEWSPIPAYEIDGIYFSAAKEGQ